MQGPTSKVANKERDGPKCREVVYNTILYYTSILEVNLFAFAYRLHHEDFSPINGALYYIVL